VLVRYLSLVSQAATIIVSNIQYLHTYLDILFNMCSYGLGNIYLPNTNIHLDSLQVSRTFRVLCTALLVFRIQVDMSTLMDYLTETREATAMQTNTTSVSKFICS